MHPCSWSLCLNKHISFVHLSVCTPWPQRLNQSPRKAICSRPTSWALRVAKDSKGNMVPQGSTSAEEDLPKAPWMRVRREPVWGLPAWGMLARNRISRGAPGAASLLSGLPTTIPQFSPVTLGSPGQAAGPPALLDHTRAPSFFCWWPQQHCFESLDYLPTPLLPRVGSAGQSSIGQSYWRESISPRTDASISLQRSRWAFRWKPIQRTEPQGFMKPYAGIQGN